MAILPITGLETLAAATINQLPIINANFLQLERLLGGTSPTYAASMTLDFRYERTVSITLTGDLSLSFSNLAAGRQMIVFLTASGATRTVTWPVGMVWTTDAVASIPSGTTVAVMLFATGTTAGSVFAAQLGAGASSFLPYAQKVLGMGPIAYWPLNETSGTNFTDATTNGNDGTSYGGLAVNQRQSLIGSPDKAPLFDGVDDMIVITDTSGLDFTPNSDPFSVSFWYSQTSTSNLAIITKHGSGTNRNFHFSTSGTNTVVVCMGGPFNTITIPGDLPQPRSGALIHVAIVSDGSTVVVYWNGVEVGSFSAGSTTENAVDWLFGARRTGGENVNTGAAGFFPGNLANVAFFTRALTVEEVGSLSYGRNVL